MTSGVVGVGRDLLARLLLRVGLLGVGVEVQRLVEVGLRLAHLFLAGHLGAVRIALEEPPLVVTHALALRRFAFNAAGRVAVGAEESMGASLTAFSSVSRREGGSGAAGAGGGACVGAVAGGAVRTSSMFIVLRDGRL